MKPVLPFHRSWLSCIALLCVSASTALAQATDLTALHPCVNAGEGENEAEVAQLQSLCVAEVAGRGVPLVEPAQVKLVLQREPSHSCAASSKRNACLARLATRTKASRALLLVVAPYAPVTRVSGFVIDAQGKVLEERKLELSRVMGRPVRETLIFAVRSVLDTLSLSAVELAPLVEDAPLAPPVAEVTPAPAPVATVTVPMEPTSRTWKTKAAYAGAGVGVVALGVSALLLVQAGDRLDTLDAAYANGAIPPPERRSELQSLQDSASTRQTLAGITAGTGIALIGAGAYLWFADRPDRPSSLSLGPSGVRGTFAFP